MITEAQISAAAHAAGGKGGRLSRDDWRRILEVAGKGQLHTDALREAGFLPIGRQLAWRLAHDAIGLFIEYRDKHGNAEAEAQLAAECEVAEGASVHLPGDSPWDARCRHCGDEIHQPTDDHPADERWFDSSGDQYCPMNWSPAGDGPHVPDAPGQPCGAPHPPLPFVKCAACEVIRRGPGCAVDPDCTVPGPHEHDEGGA